VVAGISRRTLVIILLGGLGCGDDAGPDRLAPRDGGHDSQTDTVPAVPAEVFAVASGSSCSGTLAVDDRDLFWTNLAGQVQSVPKSGGSPTLLTAGAGASAMAIQGGRLYLSVVEQNGTRSTVAIAKSGGTPVTVAAFGADHLTTDTAGAFMASSSAAPPGIYALPAGGGPPVHLATTGVIGAGGLGLDGSFVYWAEGGRLQRVPRSGGPAAVIELMPPTQVSGPLDLDGGEVFWTGVYRAPSSGGPATLLANHAFDALEVVSRTVFGRDREGIVRITPEGTSSYLARGQFVTRSLAADQTHVYFATCDSVCRCDRTCLNDAGGCCQHCAEGFETGRVALLRISQR
jgi:hypothetical protein